MLGRHAFQDESRTRRRTTAITGETRIVMRRVLLPAAAATIVLAATGAHAATRDVTNAGNTWTPAAFHAEAGDTIRWTISAGTHTVVKYAGDGPAFASGNLTPQSAPYTQPFNGGQVWYRCTFHSVLNPGGACQGHCGSYTDRTSASAAPSITSPSSGSSVGANPYPVAGTAEPWMLVVVEQNGTEIGRGQADGSGNWTAPATSPAAGSVTITARAFDAEGRVSPASAPVTFDLTSAAPDVQPPTVTITTPTLSIFVPDEPVITGTASDNVGVMEVKLTIFNAAGQPAGTFFASCPCPSAPNATISWSGTLAGILPGAYNVVATARDAAGRTAGTQPITIVFL